MVASGKQKPSKKRKMGSKKVQAQALPAPKEQAAPAPSQPTPQTEPLKPKESSTDKIIGYLASIFGIAIGIVLSDYLGPGRFLGSIAAGIVLAVFVYYFVLKDGKIKSKYLVIISLIVGFALGLFGAALVLIGVSIKYRKELSGMKIAAFILIAFAAAWIGVGALLAPSYLTLISQGTSTQIPYGNVYFVNFTVQSGYNLSGSFTSTYPVETAIMTQGQFAALGNPYGTPSYVWFQFPKTAGSFTVPLQAGNYTFLFINNQSGTSTVTITSDVALSR